VLTTPTAASPTSVPTSSPFLDLLASVELRHLVVIRVSEQSLAALSSQSELGFRLRSAMPAVQATAELPNGILADNADGEALRTQHGVVTVHRRDASPYADSPGTVMGYAVPAGVDGMVLFIHDSAAQPNVRVPTDSLPRVAFTELMLGVFSKCPNLTSAYFNDWKRMIRNELEGQRLFEGARLYSVQLWVGDKPLDIHSDGGRTIAGVEGVSAATERNGTRRRTTGGVLSALTSGDIDQLPSWPYAPFTMPLGWGSVLDDDGKPITHSGAGTRRWKLIAPRDEEVKAMREVLALVASGASWVDCAEPLVRAKVACRGPKWDGKTYDQIPRAKRGISVRNIVDSDENRRLWRTGRYVRLKEVPVANDGTFEGFTVTAKRGTYGVVEIDIDLGLPPGGFMDEETATLIERRLARREPKDGEQRSHVKLFSYLPSYRDATGADFNWERRLFSVGDCYVLRERDRCAAVDARGRARGWEQREGRQVITVRKVDLEGSVADAVVRAVGEVVAQRLCVHIRERNPSDECELMRERIRVLENEASSAKSMGETADKVAAALATAPGEPDTAGIARHTKAASEHFAAAERLDRDINVLRDQLQDALQKQSNIAIADLSTPAAVAGCLAAYVGQTIPLELSQALRLLGMQTLKIEADAANTRLAKWSLTLELPLVDGGKAAIPISGLVRNRRRDLDAGVTERELGAAIGQAFLRDGLELDVLARSFGKDRASVVNTLRGYLSRQGVRRRGLRAAIVDLPPEMAETRLALWGAISGELESSSHLSQLRSYVRRIYLGDLEHPNCWVRSDTALVRRVLRVMVDALPAAGVDGVNVEALARATGSSVTEINLLCGDRVRGGRHRQFPGVLVRDHLNKSAVRMRACPHPDCTAAVGFRWLSYYLPVPETDEFRGLICPDCHRLPDPDLADLYLPAAYFDTAWNGPVNAAHLDIKEGPVSHAADPSLYQPCSRPLRRSDRVYSLVEAAERLGISDWALRNWILDDSDKLPARRLRRGGGLKYGLTEETLELAERSPRLAELRRTSPRIRVIADEYVTLNELSAVTGVPEHFLRERVANGALGDTTYRSPAGYRQVAVARSVLNSVDPMQGTELLPAEWIERHQGDLLKIGDAAARSGVTPPVIRDAVASGRLRSFVTDGGTHRFAAADIDRWAAVRRRAPLTPKDAGDRVGVHPDELRRAVHAGELQADRTPGGHARYAPDELDRWMVSRGGRS
jgi:excisionase family DNA binding protein